MSDIEPMREDNEPVRKDKLSTAELAGTGQTDLKLRADGESGIADYMAEKNTASIDGLPAFDAGERVG